MNKSTYALNVASWYPENSTSTSGIFVQKHVALISAFSSVITLSVHPSNKNTVVETSPSEQWLEVRVFYKSSPSKLINQLLLIGAFFRGYFHIQKKYGTPKLLHLHVVFPAGVFVWLLLLFKKIPLLITEHWTGYMDADGRYEKLPRLMKYMTRALMQKTVFVSAVSHHLKNILQQKFLLAEQKVLITSNVLHLPIDVAKHTGIQNSDQHISAMYLGSIDSHHKNIGLLIEATHQLLKKSQLQLSLHLYGNGPQLEHYKSACKQQGTLDKSIFFHGSVANHLLPEIYQQHDFFVMPSRYETFSIATAEAIIYGLPVVCTKCGGPEEFVRQQQGVITEQTALSFAEGMEYMINHLHQFSTNISSDYMTEHYHPNVVTQQLKNLYQLSPE